MFNNCCQVYCKVFIATATCTNEIQLLDLRNSLHGFEKKRRADDFSEIADLNQSEEKVHFIVITFTHAHMRHT